MTHGTGFLAKYSSFETVIAGLDPRVGRVVAFFVRYLELRLQLLGLESREAGFHLLILALLFVSVLICFGGFVIMSVVFLLYLMMLFLHWNGVGAPGTCSGASAYQHWNGGHLQIQDREAIFPGDLKPFGMSRNTTILQSAPQIALFRDRPCKSDE